MKKRVVACVSIIVLVLLSTISLSGCIVIDEDGWFFRDSFLPEYESGYYRYAVKTFGDGTKDAYIVGLTESGLQQKVLIFPNEINGIPVVSIGYRIESVMVTGTPKYVGDMESENLEKVYFIDRYDMITVSNIVNGIIENKIIIEYNYYVKRVETGYKVRFDNSCVANTLFVYNYEDSPNDGCYWIDSYDESVINFIPPEPQREGYQFDGWYKESECINEWDFAIDTIGKEINIGYEYIETCEVNYLYAKWIKE